MCFLLLVAWMAMKLMQHGGDLDGMLREVQSWFGGFGGKVGGTVNSVMDSVRPKVTEMIQSIQTFFNGSVSVG